MLEENTNTKDWAATLRTSKSHIQTYLICPRKFYFQYVVALPWEFVPASLPFGSALHAAVAFFYGCSRKAKRRTWPSFCPNSRGPGKKKPRTGRLALRRDRARNPWRVLE